jgi:NADH-quinone oxidoreductase subunit J
MSIGSEQIVFSYLAAASVASAILAITRSNPVHNVLWVLALFLHVAGLFLLIGAEFLAAVQVIVYAGAILVFYLFFLMLLDLPSETAERRFGSHWPLGAAIAAGFVIAAVGGASPGVASPAPGSASAVSRSNVTAVGDALFTDFALPFEIVSLVLLAAIVGAVVLARRKTET